MKKGVLFAAVVALVSTLVACGPGEPTAEDYQSFSPKLSTTTIKADGDVKGELSDYVKIKNTEAKVNFLELTNAEWVDLEHKQVWEIKLNVERTSKDLEWDIETLNGNYTELVMTIFDASGQPVAGLEPVGCYGHGLVDDVLSLNGGEDGWVTFTIEMGDYPDEDIIKNWSTFTIDSKVGFVKEDDGSSSDSDIEDADDEDLAALSEEEYDEMLDDYEDFVDEYIKFYKKAKEGDVNAISSYPALLEKAEKLDGKFERANKNDHLTSKQVSRYIEIQKKMMNAAMEAL